MKTFTACALMMLSSMAGAQTHQPEQAFQTMVQQQAEAWNRNDAVAFSKDFADDALFINVRGDVLQGHEAIEKIHAVIFAGPYKGTHYVATISGVRYPAPTVAVLQVDTEVTKIKALPPGLLMTGPGTLRTHFVFVIADVAGTWKIVSAQNTSVSPQPMNLP